MHHGSIHNDVTARRNSFGQPIPRGMSYGAVERDGGALVALEEAASRPRRLAGALGLALLGLGAVAAANGAAPRPAPRLAAAAKPFLVDGVEPHRLPEKPFDAFLFDSVVNVSHSAALCAEFDDDASFPDASCDCGDARTQCLGNMASSPRYRDFCFDAACGAANVAAYEASPLSDPVARCAALTAPAWGVPCAWQAVAKLPETCAGTFAPEAPDRKSRDEPNAFADLDSYDRYALGYAANFAGPCNAHAYCYTCADENYAGGLNPYCAAVFARYGGTPMRPDAAYHAAHAAGRGGPHVSFFEDLDAFWCDPAVLGALERAAATLRLS